MDVCITAPCVVPVIQQGHVNITRANNSTPYLPKTGGPVLAKHGDKLSVKCDGKYEPSGGNNDLATCNNGTWTYIPKCEPGKKYNYMIIFIISASSMYSFLSWLTISTAVYLNNCVK